MSTNRANAGVSGAGADVLDVVSAGPYTISAGDSVVIAFALIAGDDLTDIQTSAANAQLKYNGLLTAEAFVTPTDHKSTMRIFPNPTVGLSTIDINVAKETAIELRLFNLFGEEIKLIISEHVQAGIHQYSYDTSLLPNGLYYYQLNTKEGTSVQKLVVAN